MSRELYETRLQKRFMASMGIPPLVADVHAMTLGKLMNDEIVKNLTAVRNGDQF